MKNKKMTIIIIIICAAVVAVALATMVFLNLRKKGGNNPNTFGGEPIGFKHFCLSESGMSAVSEVYEGTKTEKGVLLEYYYSYPYWDEERNESSDVRKIIRSVEGDEDLYKEVCELLGNCQIKKWDGFSGANPPGVLDGTSMSFEAELSDGTEINASGSNNFPSNYGTLSSSLYDLTTLMPITSTQFTKGCYTVTLPESWIGTVTARFSDTYVAFSVPKKDGERLTFFIIDDNDYGYYEASDRNADEVKIGRIQKDNTIYYISARNLYLLDQNRDSISEEALHIADSYDDDRKNIIDSLNAVDGGTLTRENEYNE